ncbi:MAG: nucleoside triphosphate pyrophosphohydrolase [Acidimicrobiia bacterium]|jgi:tetrapyrrole methylase family protein/MazG family protein
MITVIGLGPGELDRVPKPVRALLEDPATPVIVRTLQHPAATQLAELRPVVSCDDLYQTADEFDDVYRAIAERVIAAAGRGPVVYAVPGSPMIGEFAVRRLLASDLEVEVVPGESFVDAVLLELGYDPLDRGLQILNGHELPDPLILDKPTVIGHLDTPETLADVLDAVGRVIPEGSPVTILAGVGDESASVTTAPVEEHDPGRAGLRTSLFVDVDPGGLVGAVRVIRLLREECPWDREQTHQSLVKNLIEEAYELIEAINRLPREGIDWVAYAAVEDELGDVLLQVLFHEAIARQNGAFDIDGVAEVMRQKLVRRHPHVFGDVVVEGPEDVKRNWDRIKAGEDGRDAESALDGIPGGIPAMQRASKMQNRAARLGFDWERASQVLPKVTEELEELADAMSDGGDVEAELGDVIFSVINLSRHLGLDAELALSRANASFERRFRRMEAEGPLEGLDLDGLNERWERAKADGEA